MGSLAAPATIPVSKGNGRERVSDLTDFGSHCLQSLSTRQCSESRLAHVNAGGALSRPLACLLRSDAVYETEICSITIALGARRKRWKVPARLHAHLCDGWLERAVRQRPHSISTVSFYHSMHSDRFPRVKISEPFTTGAVSVLHFSALCGGENLSDTNSDFFSPTVPPCTTQLSAL